MTICDPSIVDALLQRRIICQRRSSRWITRLWAQSWNGHSWVIQPHVSTLSPILTSLLYPQLTDFKLAGIGSVGHLLWNWRVLREIAEIENVVSWRVLRKVEPLSFLSGTETWSTFPLMSFINEFKHQWMWTSARGLVGTQGEMTFLSAVRPNMDWSLGRLIIRTGYDKSFDYTKVAIFIHERRCSQPWNSEHQLHFHNFWVLFHLPL
jgi:hypothetical protein